MSKELGSSIRKLMNEWIDDPSDVLHKEIESLARLYIGYMTTYEPFIEVSAPEVEIEVEYVTEVLDDVLKEIQPHVVKMLRGHNK